MKNLHNIGLSDLEYAALWYIQKYTPSTNVSLRFKENILQCNNKREITVWADVKPDEIDKLFKRWAEEGSPKYPGNIDRV